jgi:lipoprotein-anchoring transpeptidase ErfK/SrfK
MRVLMATVALFLAWTLLSVQEVQAQDGNGITSPSAGAVVSGTVGVHGVAIHPTFRKWQLDLLITGDERQAHFLALGEKPIFPAAELAKFDSTIYHNGSHTLRLRVVYLGLNYDEYLTPVRIQNSGMTPVTGDAGATDEAAADLVKDEAAKPAEPAPVAFRTDAPPNGEKRIEIDISDQRLVAWQGDVPVFETTVSTGKPGWRTLPGTFHVYRKYEQTRMTGPGYDTPDVPWTMYYSGGFAVHGAYWHNNFGTPVSHGCVNLRVPEAKALYEWAPMGTEVVVNQ